MAKPCLFNVSPGAFSKEFFNFLPIPGEGDGSEGGVGNRAFCVMITLVAFPLICLAGTLTHLSLAAVKGGMGFVQSNFPEKKWVENVTPLECYDAAFRHLCYFALDLVGKLFFLFVAGAYACSPKEVKRHFNEADACIRSGNASLNVFNFFYERFGDKGATAGKGG